jgi:hypothetical protein
MGLYRYRKFPDPVEDKKNLADIAFLPGFELGITNCYSTGISW